MKIPALQNKQVRVLRMAFRARNVFGTFEKRALDLFPFVPDLIPSHFENSCLRQVGILNHISKLKFFLSDYWKFTSKTRKKKHKKACISIILTFEIVVF